MNPWAIPAILSIFGGVEGYDAGRDVTALGRDQELMAEENRILAKRELQEKVRRQSAEDQRLQSAALAAGAASGAKVGSGSIATHLAYMEDEQGRQLNWLKTSGASRIRLDFQGAMIRARATKMQGKSQGIAALLGGFTRAFGFMDKGGMFG